MNNQIKTYYIPNNPNITKGIIYTLYINNNTNLDLTSIITDEKSNYQNKLIIENTNYNKLILLNKQINDSIVKRSNIIQNFIKIEKENLTELSKLNQEYQKILKQIIERKV